MKPEDLTAWALNELGPDERSRLEDTLRQDAPAQQSAEQTRQFCDFLTQELRDDALSLTAAQRARLRGLPVAAASGGQARLQPARQRPVSWHRLLRPALVAAAVLLFLGLVGYLALPRSWRAGLVEDTRFAMKPGGSESKQTSLKPGLPAPVAPQARPLPGWETQGGPAIVSLPPPPQPQDATAKGPPVGLMRPGQHLAPGFESPPRSLSGQYQGFVAVSAVPHSSIALKVGADSYDEVRRFLLDGRLPPPEAVRVGELLNAFPLSSLPTYPVERPLSVFAELVSCPWQPRHRLLLVHILAGKAPQGGPPVPTAKNVHATVRFHPGAVHSYRRLGQDGGAPQSTEATGSAQPRDESSPVEGAVIATGQSVTVLYELVPPGSKNEKAPAPGDEIIAPPAIQLASPPAVGRSPIQASTTAALTVLVDYQKSTGGLPTVITVPLTDSPKPLEKARADVKFRVALAGFGLLLRGGADAGSLTWDQVAWLAAEGKDTDPGGQRGELLQLIEKARHLTGK